MLVLCIDIVSSAQKSSSLMDIVHQNSRKEEDKLSRHISIVNKMMQQKYFYIANTREAQAVLLVNITKH